MFVSDPDLLREYKEADQSSTHTHAQTHTRFLFLYFKHTPAHAFTDKHIQSLSVWLKGRKCRCSDGCRYHWLDTHPAFSAFLSLSLSASINAHCACLPDYSPQRFDGIRPVKAGLTLLCRPKQEERYSVSCSELTTSGLCTAWNLLHFLMAGVKAFHLQKVLWTESIHLVFSTLQWR